MTANARAQTDVSPVQVTTEPAPNCTLCSWVPDAGRWRLKAISRACREHGALLGARTASYS